MFGWVLLSGVAITLVGYIALVAQREEALRRRLPLAEPAQFGLAYADIRFRVRGEPLTISAWHIPAPRATRAVIIAHDSAGCWGREFALSSLELAVHLVDDGFSVLMLDLRDHSVSDSARTIYDIHELRDLLGAVDWLLAHGYAPGTIGVLGASIGAVAGIAAANQELAIGALIIDSACADILTMLRRHLRRFSKLPLYALPDGRLLAGTNRARQRSAELLRVIDRRPVQILHTLGDQLVPVECSRALVRLGDAELWVADCASHLGIFGANPHAYHQQVSRFFARALAGRLAVWGADEEAYELASAQQF